MTLMSVVNIEKKIKFKSAISLIIDLDLVNFVINIKKQLDK